MIDKYIEPLKSLLIPLYSKGGWRLRVHREAGHVPASLNEGNSISYQSYELKNSSDSDVRNVEIRCLYSGKIPDVIESYPAALGYQLNNEKTVLFIPLLASNASITLNQSGYLTSSYQVFIDGKKLTSKDRYFGSLIEFWNDFEWANVTYLAFLFLTLAIVFFVGKFQGAAEIEPLMEKKGRSIATASHRIGAIPFLWEFDREKDTFRLQGVLASHAVHCPNIDLLKLNAVKDYEELMQVPKVVACVVGF
jgi:hypothetical protein